MRARQMVSQVVTRASRRRCASEARNSLLFLPGVCSDPQWCYPAVDMSRDGSMSPSVSGVGEEAAETASATETSALLDAVRSVVQQELHTALAWSAGPEGTPGRSAVDPATATASSSGAPSDKSKR